VKSIITSPADGAQLRRTATIIQGAAWAGEKDVAKVEISTDEGKTWHAAQLGPEHAKYCWRLWSFPWTPLKTGDFVLVSRATDSAGRVQPMQESWNPSGYLWNAVDRVRLHVA
jgi:hypothetical protein